MKKEQKIIFGLIVLFLIIIAGAYLLNSKNKITGNVPLDSCTDTDDGDFPLVKGTCSIFGGDIYEDSCTEEILTEYYCRLGDFGEDICKAKIYDCATEGGVCSDGACVISEATNCSDGTSLNSCSSTTNSKYCNTVAELVNNCTECECLSGTCDATTQECEAECSSTDTGINFSVFGDSTLNDLTWNDSCINSTTLNETYCSSNELAFTLHECNSTLGEVCSEGACKIPLEGNCTDSDNGIKEDVFGTCSDSLGDFPDVCSSSSSVKEFSCNQTTEFCEFSIKTCGTSEICENGKCVLSQGGDPQDNGEDEEEDYSDSDAGTNLGNLGAVRTEGGSGAGFGIFLMVLGLAFIIISFIKKAKAKKMDQSPKPYSKLLDNQTIYKLFFSLIIVEQLKLL